MMTHLQHYLFMALTLALHALKHRDSVQDIYTTASILGLGGFAILVLDIIVQKKTTILLFIAVFTKTYGLTVLLESFYLFH